MGHVEDHLRTALAERYAIERELGAGGMATVYLARDLKHHRRVALKVLRADLAAALGRERFLREIEIAAGLTHPHIVPLFDSGEAAGFLYYFMPYIEGESLRQRLLRETHLPVPEALELAAQLGEALDYAHRAGIIHRDIKPENVLLQGGNALLADFGIAAAVTAAGGERLTETGLSLGTPEYMSPEQATGGQRLDARSDVYALGAVVYEMLVGEPPHTGPTPQAVMAKLLTERPTGIRVVRDTVPEGVERAVMRALNTLPVDRFATAGEFVEELRRPSPVASETRRPAWRRRIRVAVALGVVATTVLAGVWIAGSESPPAARPLFRQLTFTGQACCPAISPDGQFVAYNVLDLSRVMIQQLATGETVSVSVQTLAQADLRFSRDGTSLIYQARNGDGSRVYSVPLLGGSPRRLAGTDALVGAFALAESGRDLLRFEARGLDTTLVIRHRLEADGPSDTTVWHFAPISYVDLGPADRWAAAVAQTPLDSTTLAVTSLDGVVRSKLAAGPIGWVRSPRWGPNGDAIYYVQGPTSSAEVMKARINPRAGGPVGDPTVLLTGVPVDDMDLSGDAKRMVFDRGELKRYLWTTAIPKRASGDPLTLTRIPGSTGFDWDPAVSPDGGQIAFARGQGRQYDVYVQAVEGGHARRITSIEATISDVQWSPDGTQLAFASDASGEHAVMVVSLTERRPRRVGAWPVTPWRYFSPRLAWIRDTTIVYVAYPRAATEGALRTVNPVTGTERTVELAETWSDCVVVASPDGDRILTGCPGIQARESWSVVSLVDGAVTELIGFEVRSAAWTEGDRIFGTRRRDGATEVWSTLSSGGRPVLQGRLSRECNRIALAPDGSFLVCQENVSESNIWLVENFDPDVR